MAHEVRIEVSINEDQLTFRDESPIRDFGSDSDVVAALEALDRVHARMTQALELRLKKPRSH